MRGQYSIKLLAIFLLVFLFSKSGITQSEFYDILNDSNNYHEIVEKAEAYFKEKYPGLSHQELCKGEHRDGTFVKYMRWKEYWKHRLNEDGSLGDPTKYYREESNKERNIGPYDDIPWNNLSLAKNLGGQVGVGRTTGICFHPNDKNIFYVSTAIGGVWKTEDGGLTYVTIGDNLPTLAIGTVLLDHTNTETIYVGTGDRVSYGNQGIGIYKSVDGGASWSETAVKWNFSEQVRIYAMAMHPENSSIIYAATDNGLYKTIDGFESFELVHDVVSYDVQFKPKDPSILYYTAGNKLFRSVDDGESFDPIHTGLFGIARIALTEADPERVYYSRGNSLYQSFDNGNTFSEAIEITQLENRNFGYIIISNENPDVLYGGYFTTWKSINNGQTWSEITCFTAGRDIHVDNHFAATNPLEPGKVFFCNDGGLYKFQENNCSDCESCFSTFEDLSGGMMISQFYDISHSQQNINVVSGGTQDNASYERNRYGQWESYVPSGDGMIAVIDPHNDNYKYWEYQYGTINRTVNGENTCISCNIPNNEGGNGSWVTPYAIDPNDGEVLMAGFTRVYRSKDRGETWKQASSTFAAGDLLDHIAFAPNNSDVVYVTQGINLYSTSSATNHTLLTWRSKTMPFEDVTSIEVSPADENVLYITRGGYIEGAKVYVSYTGGDNWENISGNLPNVPVSIVKNVITDTYPNVLLLGTDVGVFYLDDELEEWVEYGALPHTQVIDIEIQYANELIRIGTHGRSIFEAPLPKNPCLSDNPPDEDGDGVCDAYDLCPGSDDFEDLNEDGTPDGCEPACFASGTPETEENWINFLSASTLSNFSGQSTYSNFTHLKILAEQGAFYSIEMGLNAYKEGDQANIWIDFNRDQAFTSDERIPMQAYNDEAIAFGKFHIPQNMELGRTLMRVRNTNASFGVADPCNEYEGEVEDYTLEVVASITTAIEENPKTNFGLKVYPNPGNDLLYFECLGYDDSSIHIEVINAVGEICLKKEVEHQKGNHNMVNTKYLKSGLYVIKITDGKRSSIKKWVKNLEE